MSKNLGIYITKINDGYVISKTISHLSPTKPLIDIELDENITLNGEDADLIIRIVNDYSTTCLYAESVSSCPDDCSSCDAWDEETEECSGAPSKLRIVLEVGRFKTNYCLGADSIDALSDYRVDMSEIIKDINEVLVDNDYTEIREGVALV